MEKIIRNNWRRESGEAFATARILSHEIHPEGLDIDRIRFFDAGSIAPKSSVGHIISVLGGSGRLHVAGTNEQTFYLEAGVHIYLPPGIEIVLDADPGAEFLQVSSASALQARGKRLLLRDENFLAACAVGSQMLRWVLTPQYLSRRIFLHHDQTLLSKSGNPVSWFRTTMFDVAGLPENEEGEPVFKMSYNSRTECNVCYDVMGTARVRMAKHPYKKVKQLWSPWFQLDRDATYHLNETAGSPDEECHIDKVTGNRQFFRNKHEVHIVDGHVTLCCLFDPAPTGVERHRPGEYSDYESLPQVLGTKEYDMHQRGLARYDEMVDRLSMAKALGALRTLRGTPLWNLYAQGRDAQAGIESGLARNLVVDGNVRDRVIARWMRTSTD
jgi:quercetin dioxygenase-like cupin family protein